MRADGAVEIEIKLLAFKSVRELRTKGLSRILYFLPGEINLQKGDAVE